MNHCEEAGKNTDFSARKKHTSCTTRLVVNGTDTEEDPDQWTTKSKSEIKQTPMTN